MRVRPRRRRLGCRVERWRGAGFDDADVSIALPKSRLEDWRHAA
jgi:hypothetical protein